MREFEYDFSLEGLNKGLRNFSNNPRNNKALVECHNVGPGKGGPELHEPLTDLNADGITWGGEGLEDQPSTTRDITIVVKDYVTEAELPDAHVYVDGVDEGVADSNGEVNITGIELGGHSIRITLAGYLDSDADDLLNDYFVVV